ncbi:hypothetical protein [Streptomyces sp. CRB46]|uniref:hypothetical protein n=1 Tax=Streptomyces sp. CRB46 TaxID=2682613 RepID=UPI0018F5155F|nr:MULTISPECIES: hypothetical protein [Streptomyces]WMI62042.1 hypothetical protein RBH85_36880 [Streptomyces rochei]
MKMTPSRRRPRASSSLWAGSYLALVWAVLVDLADRVLLFFTPTPRERPARGSILTLAALTALVGLRTANGEPHRNN